MKINWDYSNSLGTIVVEKNEGGMQAFYRITERQFDDLTQKWQDSMKNEGGSNVLSWAYIVSYPVERLELEELPWAKLAYMPEEQPRYEIYSEFLEGEYNELIFDVKTKKTYRICSENFYSYVDSAYSDIVVEAENVENAEDRVLVTFQYERHLEHVYEELRGLQKVLNVEQL